MEIPIKFALFFIDFLIKRNFFLKSTLIQLPFAQRLSVRNARSCSILCPQQSITKCLAGLFRCYSWPACPAAKGATPSRTSPLRFLFCYLSASFAEHHPRTCRLPMAASTDLGHFRTSEWYVHGSQR